MTSIPRHDADPPPRRRAGWRPRYGPESHDLHPEFHYANTHARWTQRLHLSAIFGVLGFLLAHAIAPIEEAHPAARVLYFLPLAAIVGSFVALVVHGRRVQRIVLQNTEPPCPGCGYLLGFMTPCPECGSELDLLERKEAWRDAVYNTP